jgi:hypothetical protein
MLQVPRAAYVSGANPPAVGQTTRVAITVEVSNVGNELLDLSDSVVCDLGPTVALGGVMLSDGMARLDNRTAIWDDFSLMPGERATLTMTLDITPPAGSAGQSLLVVSDVVATARTPAGALVQVQTAGATTAGITGLANGGLVVVMAQPAPAAPPAAPAAVPAARPAAPAAAPAAAPRPAATTAPATVALPRTGTGLTADTSIESVLPLIGGVGLVLAIGLGYGLIRRRMQAR